MGVRECVCVIVIGRSRVPHVDGVEGHENGKAAEMGAAADGVGGVGGDLGAAAGGPGPALLFLPLQPASHSLPVGTGVAHLSGLIQLLTMAHTHTHTCTHALLLPQIF